jgi:hypothetical protein
MSKKMERFDFDQVPRAPLPFNVNRRRLFSSLFTEFNVYSGKNEGGTAYKLADLGVWPDEKLYMLTPAVTAGCKISLEDGLVCGQPEGVAKPVQLFPLDSPALAAFNLFNGQTLLGEVSRQMAKDQGWEAAHAFAYVRGLFLWLVLAGICQPKG